MGDGAESQRQPVARRRAVASATGAALILAAAAGMLARVASPGHDPAPPSASASAPVVVEPVDPAAGLQLVFEDDFSSLGTIDLTGTGQPGHKWFTDLPFGWGRTEPGWLQVEDGVLTIDPQATHRNYQIGTASPASGEGRGFHYGYFEASLAFDPADAPGSDGFPAFWGVSLDQALGGNNLRTMELDFFEGMPADGQAGQPYDDSFAGTVHDLTLNPEVDRANYGNNIRTLPGTNWTEFHRYGCLWEPGRLTWYFDGTPVLQQHYDADSPPSPNPQGHPAGMFALLDADTRGQMVILGTGRNYPLRVDWVRIHQRPAGSHSPSPSAPR